MSAEHLTVGELIDKLKDLPRDLYVKTEGCDCYGPCNGVSVEPEDEWSTSYVLLERNHGRDSDMTDKNPKMVMKEARFPTREELGISPDEKL